MGAHREATGPDFRSGLKLADLQDGATLAGRVGDQPVLVTRRGQDFFAVGGTCTHYGALLADGLIECDHAHCPLHHACFNLRTGEAVSAPAFDPLTRWRVEIEGDRLFVREQIAAEERAAPAPTPGHPRRVVIVGGGAAGFAAAEMLRRRGFAGKLTILSADAALPCDRPNLSKDYLAGTAPEEWIPLKDEEFYRQNNVDLRLGAAVQAIDRERREVILSGAERLAYDALLLATGATPVRPSAPGFDLPNVHVLRTLADARAIIAGAGEGKTVAILGASFIGLEAASALRTRGLAVHVIAPEAVPLERVLGAEIGAFLKRVHEAHGVQFHLGRTADMYAGHQLRLSDGTRLDADMVVLGVGVRPNIQLAANAGLAVDGGVMVDNRMRTSDPAVFAAGDIAKYPDPATGAHIRVEHWVAAERQGQAAARSMLGEDQVFVGTPFFWSAHYDHSIRYVGHAAKWDTVTIDGSIDAADFTARYMAGGRVLAVASLGRDVESLTIEADMDRAALEALSRDAQGAATPPVASG